jgi:O-antigen/teichoic acid export membrane protein
VAFGYSLRAHIANVAQFVNYSADLFFVSYFVGLSGVGFYALAVNVAQVVWLISWAAATVVFPHVASHETGAEEAATNSARATRITAGGSIGAALVLGILANPVIRIVFGARFEPAVSAVYWLLPGIVALALARVLASYFAGVGRPDINAALSGLGLLLTLPLDLLLIPTLGINGAAMASSVSYMAIAAGTLTLFCRRTRMPIRAVVLPTLGDARAMTRMIRSPRLPRLGQ